MACLKVTGYTRRTQIQTYIWLELICTELLSPTKKTEIVDVVVVNSVMWAEGVKGGERGKSQRVGQLLPGKGPEWMGIRHHEQETGPPSKSGFFNILPRG
jgi:hypothetical protein